MPKAPHSAPSTTDTPANYEAALAELESLVQRLESGQMPLAELLTGYRRGAELLAYCRAQLEAIESQIQVLDDGVLQPWNPQE